ncbi:MAG: hypothetical protein OXQ31_10700 [Spirochaetaceae bacterium]|nr:hypothetical protein [Spirochaetaceae bacterium]
MRITIVLLSILASTAAASSQEITFRTDSVGSFNSWDVRPGLLIYSSVLLPSLPRQIDEYLTAQGDLESEHWSRRVYWRGSTVIRHGGESLGLRSRVTYDQWARVNLLFDELKTRVFQDTKWVEWELTIPPARLDELRLVGEVTNIEGLPDFIDDLLVDHFATEIDVPLPSNCGSCSCKDLAERLNANFRGAVFSPSDDGSARVDVEFTVEVDPEVLPCVNT